MGEQHQTPTTQFEARPVIRKLLETLLRGRSPGCSAAGWLSLQLGVLFLPTSALLAGLGMLIAITIARPKLAVRPLERPIARALLLLSGLMVLAVSTALNPSKAALGLANWLPFFWFFLAIEPYLHQAVSRRRLALWLVVGTIPVVVVGLLQVGMGWSTPLRALGGLLEWTMRYPERATGIFDTVNGTAGWLLISFPFLLQRLREPYHRFLTLTVVVLWSATLLLTSSRSALVLLPVVTLLSSRKRLLPWLVLAIGLYGLLFAAKLSGMIDHWPGIKLLVPDLLSAKVERLINPTASGALQAPEIRRSLYPLGWKLVQTSPWLGIGENGFRTLYLGGQLPLPVSEGLNHTHSLPLEFALSHGLPALGLLLGSMGWVSAAALRQWQHHADPQGQDRAWLIAAGLVIWLHIWDILAYDSRFNMAGWLIFAALMAIGSPSRQPAQMERPHRSRV